MSRERDIRNHMKELLTATNAFDDVLLGRDAEEYAAAAIGRSCNIAQAETREKPLWDQGDEVEVYCRIKVTFTGRDEDELLRDDSAERLYNVAQNALNGVSLASLTLPHFTRFESANWQKPAHPCRQIEAVFGCKYLTDDNAFDATE